MVTVSVEKSLEDFRLDVEFSSSAKVTALFAPSGSGKTLTLHSIAGLITPDKGRVEVNGRLLFDSQRGVNLPPQKRKVGYLFQDYALFPHMTVLQNLLYASKDREFIDKLLELLEIRELKHRYPSQISGGQKQRVALARALAIRPNLLLLDEPFSALHRSLKLELYRKLKEVIDEFSIPVIVVTHDLDEVFELADFMVILKKGRVVRVGRPNEVFLNPYTVETARLLGHGSFLSGKVKKCGKVVEVDVSGQTFKSLNFPNNLSPGDEVVVSVFPFSVALSPAEDSFKVRGKILDFEEKRNGLLVKFDIGGEAELHFPPSLSPNLLFEKGKVVDLYLLPSAISVLCKE